MKRLNKGKKFSQWTAAVFHSSPVAGLSRQRSLFIQNEGWRIPQYTDPPSQSNTMMISGGKMARRPRWPRWYGWYWEEQCCVVDFCPSWKFFVALNQTITNLVSCFQSQWHQSGDSVGNEAFGLVSPPVRTVKCSEVKVLLQRQVISIWDSRQAVMPQPQSNMNSNKTLKIVK